MAPDRPALHASSQAALITLTQELLLERSRHYSQTELVAYLDGWSAVLELLQKTELILPGVPAAQRDALSACVEHIRRAQYRALEDEIC